MGEWEKREEKGGGKMEPVEICKEGDGRMGKREKKGGGKSEPVEIRKEIEDWEN